MQLNDYIFSGDCSVTRLNSDSGTPQELNLMKISRQDGAKLISSNFAPKEITIGGILKGDTISDLELNIDTFKKAVMITNGNLDMDYAGSYRRYKVDCSACTISREYYNVTFAPFEVKFICSDPPFSKDISAIGGTDILNDVYSAENITSESVTNSFTVDGSAIPKGKIQYKFDAIGDIGSFDFINLSTSKQLNISTAFTSGDEILIDHDNMSVSLNGEPVEFDGVFPDLKLGSNSFESNMYLSSGTTLDASQTTNNSQKPFYGAIKLAQSFQVSTSALIPKIQLLLRKVGAITSDISFRIETNETDKPSGTAVASGTATILASSVNTSAFWININLADCELSAETTYWIVLSTTNGSSEDYYEWRSNNLGGYAGGNGARYFNSWDSLSWDFCFKVYKNIIDQNNSTETPESVTENFSTDTYKAKYIDYYDISNKTGDFTFGEETNIGVGVSFTGDGSQLNSIRIYLTNVSSVGNIVCKIYAHSGTFGSTGIPTGSALAISNTVSLSSISTTRGSYTDFAFDGTLTTTNGTYYFICLEYTGYFEIAFDDAALTFPGTIAYLDSDISGWQVDTDNAFIFYLNITSADWNTTQGKLLLNYSSESVVDSYSESNQDNLRRIGEDTIIGRAQSFTGNGYLATSATFYIKKEVVSGTPDGDMICELYEITGTYGTNSYPTGSVLATVTLSASILTTSFTLINFVFTTPYKLNNGTKYCIAVRYTGTIGTAYPVLGSDNSTPTHSGNASMYSTADGWRWGNDTNDICFYVYCKTYDNTNNIGQSLALDTESSVIASAILSKSDTTPIGTSIAYALSSDGTNFEDVTPLIEKYFTNIASALKFKATLTGTTTATPEIDTLNITYKLGVLINATTHRIAQSFVTGFTGNLGRIKLNVKKFGAPGNLTAYIYSDSAGVPDSLLATQEHTGSILSGQFGWISINFNTPASLTDETTYWIVLAASGVDSSNGYLIRSRTGNVYTNGTLKYSTNSGTDYTEYTGEDILFQTYASSGLQHQFDMRIQYNKRWL
jgi:hypothetical protein